MSSRPAKVTAPRSLLARGRCILRRPEDAPERARAPGERPLQAVPGECHGKHVQAAAQQVPAPGSTLRERPGHTRTRGGFSPSEGTGTGGCWVLLCSAHYHPTVGSGCSHHPVTMGPIQPSIPEGKSVSRKETKTEKGNSLELSVLRVPRVVAADKGQCLSALSAARLPQPWVPPRPGVPACPCAHRGSGALEAGSRCSPTIPQSKPLALTSACVSRSGRAQRCGSPEL